MIGDRLRASWEASLDRLEDEIRLAKGSDVVIGLVVTEDQISFSGQLKAGGSTRTQHRGVELSFEKDGRRVVFHTDAYDTVTANIRAIGLGLEALRAVDRHGITTSGEQYAGFALLGSGGADAYHGRQLVEAAGSLTAALKTHHPDHGGRRSDFDDVQAYRQATAKGDG